VACREAGVLGGTHRHRRAFAEGAVEHEALAGVGERAKHAAVTDRTDEIAIGRMDRAGDDAVALALARLAQVDQGDVAASDRGLRLGRGQRPAVAGGTKPTRMLAGIATSIIFGLPSLRLFISATYSSTDLT
jgi:hypothetical protein